ncbi:ATP-binding cassette sub- A member 1 [Irineochytrium annulatum]|nr:ATP-binding cassette sub- A member 1 [Irineochytrium annulatum]
MLLLFVLQQADYAKQREQNLDPPSAVLQGVAGCQGRNPGDPCITIMYAVPEDVPNGQYTKELYDGFMSTFAELNAARMGLPVLNIESGIVDLNFKPTTQMGIVPVPNADFIYAYVLQNPNTTAWGVVFSDTDTQILNIQYQIWFNSTSTANGTDIYGRNLVGFMRGLDEAITTVQASLNVTIKDWPVIPAKVLSDTIVQQVGPVFFFCAVMVIFINVLNQVVTEKELKLRHAMEMMGLKPSVYWLSNLLSNSLLVFIASLLTTILGLIFGFSAFRNTNFAVLVLTFFLFAEAMVLFAFFITTLVRRARIGVLAGIFVFIIGLLFESFVFSGSYIGYIWWGSTTTPIAWRVLVLLPFFNFGKLFLDISTFTTGMLDGLTSTFVPGPGFPWSALYTPVPQNLQPVYGNGQYPNIPPPVDSMYYLLMNIVVYGALTWYLDNVIPNEYGYHMPPWFFATGAYWGFDRSADIETTESDWLAKEVSKPAPDSQEPEDEDVHDERLRALDPDQRATVKIINLRKEYRGLLKSKTDKVAVKSLCLNLTEGKLQVVLLFAFVMMRCNRSFSLALLGQNGAGKSTTMNILSGLTPSTGGDALMYGLSVRTQMQRIRKIMGVCPQHDILFDDLTAREHINLYAGLKGIPDAELPKLIEERLTAVRLMKVADQRAGTYSGGMKRRLSMVIATIGDPQIIFLDEPTTGMDPVNRRHVWSFIESLKAGRIIVLTTHSMEEADVLGDRIVIMSHGRMRAIGSSLALKKKYGAGYRISLVCDPEKMARAKEVVIAKVPGATLEDDSAGALIFQFPTASSKAIPPFIKYLDANPDELFSSWGISQTTLEEVFLKLIRDANEEEKGRGSKDGSATRVSGSSNLRRRHGADVKTGS